MELLEASNTTLGPIYPSAKAILTPFIYPKQFCFLLSVLHRMLLPIHYHLYPKGLCLVLLVSSRSGLAQRINFEKMIASGFAVLGSLVRERQKGTFLSQCLRQMPTTPRYLNGHYLVVKDHASLLAGYSKAYKDLHIKIYIQPKKNATSFPHDMY